MLAVAVAAFCCAVSGYPVLALPVVAGGLAIAVPELIQYAVARLAFGVRNSGHPGNAAVARLIHLFKVLATVALAVGAVVTLNSMGLDGPKALFGMLAASAGYLTLVRGPRRT